MSRHESEREDLMRDATALGRRAELITPDEPERVVAGFRANGSLSIYFGADPVYHFDAAGRLRRAFVNGDLFRSQGKTLARLRRVRTPDETELRRTDLDEPELTAFLRLLRDRLERLRSAVESGSARIVQQVPADDAAFLSGLHSMLDSSLSDGLGLAPPITRRR